MNKRALAGVFLGGWLMASGSLQAHHSLAAVYEIRKETQVSGVVTKIAFTNPHGALHLNVENGDGTLTEWVMTTGSANTLASLGLRGTAGSNDAVTAGDLVTVTYFPARNGKPLGFMRSLTLPDERTFEFDPE